ncbi:ABC transporter [Streptomyces cadmiisoli]|uniref:ABC transporter n=1 Tax=Streptomyces cadmiisoli TaxID=2184053 RepID=UPI003D724C63
MSRSDRRTPPYAVPAALSGPVWRGMPRTALAAGAVLGLLLPALPRLFGTEPDAWLGVNLLRAAALCGALGLAFLLDDPARHTTAAVPVRRFVRVALRLAFTVPSAALWWTAALYLLPAESRPPVGAITLEAAGSAVVALAAAALVVRRTDRAEPGVTAAAVLLPTALAVTLLVPDRWALVVAPGDPRWEAAHERWAVVLVVAAAVFTACLPEPLRRGWFTRRRRPSAGSASGF